MKTIPISAKLEGGQPVTVDFDMPENLPEMVDEWSEEAVYNQARQAIVVSIQGRMRTMIKPTRKEGVATQEELQKMADEFEIGTRKPQKSKADKIKEAYASLDPELKKQILADMRANQDQPAQKPPAAKTAAKQPTGKQATQPPARPTGPARPAQPQRPTGGGQPTRPAATPPGVKRPAPPQRR